MGAEFLATALPSTTSSDRPPYFSHLTAPQPDKRIIFSQKSSTNKVYSKAAKSNIEQKHSLK
jgi:hypothetical protein